MQKHLTIEVVDQGTEGEFKVDDRLMIKAENVVVNVYAEDDGPYGEHGYCLFSLDTSDPAQWLELGCTRVVEISNKR
jgi:hypothetical protein